MRKIFDAHHHLWDLNHCHYPWLMAKGVKRFFGDPAPIQKNYLVQDFLEDAKEFDLIGSTHIQVGVDEEDTLRETQWLQDLANEQAQLPSAIVAFTDLTDDHLEDHLNTHKKSKNFRGIRQIIGRHPSEDKKNNTGALLTDVKFLRGLKLLENQTLSFDLQLVASQYDQATRLFEQVPDLKLAICHFASPWDLSREGFAIWQKAMKRFAALPNCYMKFSGFGMFKADWTSDDIKPYVETALEFFGENRCMAGTNFPVDKLYGNYGRIWSALEGMTKSHKTLDKIVCTNAQKFYGVFDQGST